jgi:hypothetical protein
MTLSQGAHTHVHAPRASLNCRMKLRGKQTAARLRSSRSRLSSQCLNGLLCWSGVPYQNVRGHCRQLPGEPVNTRKLTAAAYTDLVEFIPIGNSDSGYGMCLVNNLRNHSFNRRPGMPIKHSRTIGLTPSRTAPTLSKLLRCSYSRKATPPVTKGQSGQVHDDL